jgi:hypothetical protein
MGVGMTRTRQIKKAIIPSATQSLQSWKIMVILFGVQQAYRHPNG